MSLPGIVLTASLLIAPGFQGPGQTPPFPSFIDVAGDAGVALVNVSGGAEKGYIVEAIGNGAGFFDFDNDGDLDLVIANGSTIEGYETGGHPLVALYRNSGGRFHDVTRDAGLDRTGWGVGVCVADFDNDGNQDFYVTAYGPNVLYRNVGNGTFEDVTDRAGVGDTRFSTNCAFGDYDRDGGVDLYVANYLRFDPESIPRRGESDDSTCTFMNVPVLCGPLGLPGEPDVLYRNELDGTFTDVTETAGIGDLGHYGFGVVFSDLDNDGWPDIYVANDSVPNFLFHNDQDGTFSEVGLASGTARNEEGFVQAGMGVAVGDYDMNGYLDIFVTNFARDTNTLYRNLGGRSLFFIDATASANLGEGSLAHLGWGAGFADLDNDGLEDLFVANGHIYPSVDALDVGQSYRQRKEIYRNIGGAAFEEMTLKMGGDSVEEKAARGAAFGDYDNDGDIDVLVINMNGPPSLYRNEGGNLNNWVSFELEGDRSNRDAIGARIEIAVGDSVSVREVRSGGSYLSHNDLRVHFGLGRAMRVDRVRIHWPGGEVEELRDVEANRFLKVREGAGIVGEAFPP